MLNRLIELIRRGMNEHEVTIENYVIPTSDYLADYLLANGVIVPPCKVGQTLYLISGGLYWETEVIRVVIRQGKGVDPCIVFVRYKDGNIKAILDILNSIGKTVFLTKEEAEQALRKEQNK